MHSYELKSQAVRDLKKLPKEIQRRIIKKIDFYIASGKPLFFADHLVNYEIGSYRFRIGDYRVIFDIEGDCLIILTIGHRREIYK